MPSIQYKTNYELNISHLLSTVDTIFDNKDFYASFILMINIYIYNPFLLRWVAIMFLVWLTSVKVLGDYKETGNLGLQDVTLVMRHHFDNIFYTNKCNLVHANFSIRFFLDFISCLQNINWVFQNEVKRKNLFLLLSKRY